MSGKLLTTFKVKIHGLSPNEIKVNEEFSIDIVVEELTLGTLVSKFEEEGVRHEMRYTIPEWRALAPEDRAKEIAIERIQKKIEYVKNLKEMKKI